MYAVVAAEFSEDETFNNIDRIKSDKTVDAKKALILFNGKEIKYEDLDKADFDAIVTGELTHYALWHEGELNNIIEDYFKIRILISDN